MVVLERRKPFVQIQIVDNRQRRFYVRLKRIYIYMRETESSAVLLLKKIMARFNYKQGDFGLKLKAENRK